jgi:putrescine transport system substrate-binding protein
LLLKAKEKTMLRTASRTLLAAVALTGFIAAATAQEKTVNVYNWSDYVDEEVLTEFTDETGIKVVYDVYDSNDIVETKLLAGGSGYDIVVPSDSNMSRQIKAGTVMKLDKSKIPNLTHAWPLIMERLNAYDPGNEHAVNYMWGTVGIGLNVDMVKERLGDVPLNSWDIIFKPENAAKLADCGIHVIDAPEDVIQSVLKYTGKAPDSKEVADIEAAGALLQTIRPSIQKFHSSEYINALANGDICLAIGYSGDVLQARDRAAEANNGVNVEYHIPKEGAQMWFDSFIIPADAPHPDEAHAFIDFMMKPEIAAKNSNYVYYANGNLASQSMLNEDVIGDPAIYPDQETLDRLFTSTSYDPKVQRVITRLWTNLKAGG